MAKRTNAGKEINLKLTIEEVNTILESLGHMPFMRVYKIIEKVHVQASAEATTVPAAKKK